MPEPWENCRSPFYSIPEPMESLALIAACIVLGRMAYVSLCVALVVAAMHHRYVDGLLQARPGLPPSPWFVIGLVVVVIGAALHIAVFRR